MVNPLSPHDALKHHEFFLPMHSNSLLFFSPTSNHLHPLQVENCDSNSRLVVDEDDNGKSRLQRVNHQDLQLLNS